MKHKYLLSLGLNIALTLILVSLLYSLRERFAQEIIHRIGHADIAMLGDSHTEYFDCSWQLNRPVRRSARGYFTSWQIQKLLLPDAIRHHPTRCFVLCGSNDISIDPHYSESDLLKNFHSIADTLIAHHIIPIFSTIPYQYHNQDFNQRVDRVNQRLAQYCQKARIDLIDLNQLTAQNGELSAEYKRADNVHLNEKGYEVWSEKLTAYLVPSN